VGVTTKGAPGSLSLELRHRQEARERTDPEWASDADADDEH